MEDKIKIVLAKHQHIRNRVKSRLYKPIVIAPAIIFRPILTKLAPSFRGIPKSQYLTALYIPIDRLQLPVTDISQINLTLPPGMYTVTNNIGFYFDNSHGKVLLEVISSTTGQQFTVLTGLLINNEWAIADDLVNVSNANTRYFLEPYPRNIYNQPGGTNQIYVNHAINAILQFRAWRIT